MNLQILLNIKATSFILKLKKGCLIFFFFYSITLEFEGNLAFEAMKDSSIKMLYIIWVAPKVMPHFIMLAYSIRDKCWLSGVVEI